MANVTVSRWVDRFESHPFRVSWGVVKTSLREAKVDDETVVTSVAELGRLKKVVSYLDGLLDSIDPELIPFSMLDSFGEQAGACANQISAFISDKDIGHIQQANAHADNLLTYIRPYMVAYGRTAKALRQSAEAYSGAFIEHASAFQTKINALTAGINADKALISADRESISSIKSALTQLKNEFVGTGEDSSGSYGQIKNKIAEIEEKHEKVSVFYNELFVGGNEVEPTAARLGNAVSLAASEAEKASGLVKKANVSVKDLDEFHDKIFGVVDDDGKRVGGLAFELNAQQERLDEFEEQQQTRYVALNGQIESLLPGATSAGLASAYREMKSTFDKPIQFASGVFYVSIAVIIVGSLILAVDSIGPEGVKLLQLGSWETVLQSFAYKIPFYGPAIWLAYYASKRRSEYQRLQQEYAHKEALAKSYDSYKKQIEALGEPDNSMLVSLMKKAIDAISHNASTTLDGRHGDKMPIHDVVEKVFEKAVSLRGKAN